jgi:sec-independent protein translocase protein TatA
MIENILSPTHLLLIIAVGLIVLGLKRLPEAGRRLGAAIRGFKDSLSTPERRSGQSAMQSSRKPDQTLGAWLDRRGGGSRTAPAFAPKAIKMETFPLRAAAYDERLTLTQHLSELQAWLSVSPALYGASVAPLRLNERQSTRHEPLSG